MSADEFSSALVCKVNEGTALVLEAGGWLSEEIKDIGSHDTDDLGLPLPEGDGLWIFVGTPVWSQTGAPWDSSEIVEYRGSYRRLTMLECDGVHLGRRVLDQPEWEPPE